MGRKQEKDGRRILGEGNEIADKENRKTSKEDVMAVQAVEMADKEDD